MASSRKKQDEKNLKTLRELGAQPQNKYCFDCNQRGPTYVNMTIGSFVCTKCSGMLRGLTPPHRVKSISMATFTSEEIEMLKNKGNDHCRGVWLGLYEGNNLPECRDEQAVKDFMVDKYERKRYYLDPTQAFKNGYKTPQMEISKVKPLSSLVSDPKPILVNGNNIEMNRKRPEVANNKTLTTFAVNFENADIFSASNNNNNIVVNGTTKAVTQQESFANFDDNPVFNNNINNTSMPTPIVFDSFNMTQTNKPAAPSEDKYAALKDLDNEFKQKNEHNGVDWNSSGSNGSLYSSPTPSGSVYSSPSPQSSMFGSPSQGQFMSAFQSQDNLFANPFNGQGFANPFKTNSFTPNFQPNMWAGANPFKVGATGSVNPSNPFL